MRANGLEMSRPASPRLVSHETQTLGWPGRLHRVVRQPADSSYAPSGTHLRSTVPEEKVRVSTGLSLTLF